MPSYFPENNTPHSADSQERSLQKIANLISGGGVGGRWLDTISDLKAETNTVGVRNIRGYSSSTDGVELPPYYADLSDTTSVDNGGSIIVAADGTRWKWAVRPVEINIEMFGAVGNDSAINTTKIQSAHDDMVAGETMVIPEGIFLADGAIDISKAIHIRGRGTVKESTILAQIFNITSTGATFDGPTVEGIETTLSASGDSLVGILVAGNGCSVINSTVKNKSTCVKLTAARNRVIGNTLTGFLSATGTNVNLNAGVRVETNDNIISDNVITAVGNGVLQVSAGLRNHIAGNVIFDVYDNGIYCSSGEGSVVTGNKIRNTTGSSIKVRGSNYVVSHNECFEASGVAIDVTARSIAPSGGSLDDTYATNEGTNYSDHGNIVDSNIVEDCQTHGIRLARDQDGGGTNYYLWGCKVVNNRIINWGQGATGNFGVYAEGADHSIEGNYIAFGDSASGAAAIIVSNSTAIADGADSNRNQIANNIIYDPSNNIARIRILGGDDIVIVNNIIYNDGTSITLTIQNTKRARITGNISPATLRFEGTASDEPYVAGNNFKNVILDTTPTNATFVENPGQQNVFLQSTQITIESFADAGRPAAGNAGRVIFNTDDGQLNIDDGTNWTLPDGTTT